MIPDLITRAGVAEILDASGYFNTNETGYIKCEECGEAHYHTYVHPKCKCGGSFKKEFKFEFPTANQSEAILDQLGVQVVWSGMNEKGYVVGYWESNWPESPEFVALAFLDEIPRQDRELANAAAVAWFCINEPDRIKEVING